jgi:hypothetical protein
MKTHKQEIKQTTVDQLTPKQIKFLQSSRLYPAYSLEEILRIHLESDRIVEEILTMSAELN